MVHKTHKSIVLAHPFIKMNWRYFMSKNILKRLSPFLFILLLIACGNYETDKVDPLKQDPNDEQSTGQNDAKEPLEDEVIPGTKKIVDDIKEEKNPKYTVGSKVEILADRMEGMQGAKGVVVGAYDTTAYSVEYQPTTGGKKIVYKWLVDEELEGASGAPLEKGLDVVITANHVDGMEGASGEIKDSNESTVYMVDFTTTTGKEVKNYKWVTEEELKAAE